jgi:hypothetical protein
LLDAFLYAKVLPRFDAGRFEYCRKAEKHLCAKYLLAVKAAAVSAVWLFMPWSADKSERKPACVSRRNILLERIYTCVSRRNSLLDEKPTCTHRYNSLLERIYTCVSRRNLLLDEKPTVTNGCYSLLEKKPTCTNGCNPLLDEKPTVTNGCYSLLEKKPTVTNGCYLLLEKIYPIIHKVKHTYRKNLCCHLLVFSRLCKENGNIYSKMRGGIRGNSLNSPLKRSAAAGGET